MHVTRDVVGAVALCVSDALWLAMSRTSSDAAALAMVLAEPGMSVDELARLVGLTHSATVRVVDRLVADDLVVRRSSGVGRRLALTLTSKGRRVANSNVYAAQRVLDKATAGFSDDELHTLTMLSARMVLNLSAEQAEIDRACRLCDQRSCLSVGCPLPNRYSPT